MRRDRWPVIDSSTVVGDTHLRQLSDDRVPQVVKTQTVEAGRMPQCEAHRVTPKHLFTQSIQRLPATECAPM